VNSRSSTLARIVALPALSALLSMNLYAQSPATPTAAAPASVAETKRLVEPRKAVNSAAFRDAVNEARAAMDRGDFAEAQKEYAKAIEADPSNARAYFNQGVAQYRAGNLKDATESFASAAQMGDAQLAAKAMFNEGNAVYADALKTIELQDRKGSTGAAGPDAAKPDLTGAIEAVKASLIHFKDAVSADVTDTDARINAETASRLLKQLEEMKEQEDKKKEEEEEKKEEKKKEEEKKKDDQKKDQEQKKQDQPKDGQPKEDQPKDGDEGKPQDSPQKQNEQQEKKDAKEQQQQQSADKKPEESKQPEEQQQEPSQQKQEGGDEPPKAQAQAGDPVKDAPLTKQEAERILQAVRDREKARRESKELIQPTKRAPVGKDW